MDDRSEALRDILYAGPRSAPELARQLGVSQPTFARLVAGDPRVLVIGKARATRYAARRELLDVATPIPVHRIDEAGHALPLATLHPVTPAGFYLESQHADVESGFHPDLPWWLHDLRPAGFLGSLVPRLHPSLPVPRDIGQWSSTHALVYLTRHGDDLLGDLVVGDAIVGDALALAHGVRPPPEALTRRQRARRYMQLAEQVLTRGVAGASAAGEQPKFLVERDGRPMLVKFSPELDDSAVSTRVADLLVAEHVALATLRAAGHDAPMTDLVRAERMFLEVERFDRVPLERGFGRRGVTSFMAFGCGVLGDLPGWSDVAAGARRAGLVDDAVVDEVRWRELFGRFIANSDMHLGNHAFWTRGTRILGLAPIYDMLPMAYAPRAGNVRAPTFEPPLPTASNLAIWPAVRALAERCWRAVAAHALTSESFAAIASANAELLADRGRLGAT